MMRCRTGLPYVRLYLWTKNYLFETLDVHGTIASVKSRMLLPLIFVVVFALSRIPDVMSLNFSAAYAFAFCAGVFFPGRRAWWLPLAVIFATDMGLNIYYQYKNPAYDVWSAANLANLAFNYVAYVVLIFLGRCFKPQSSIFSLVSGGILGAILFYFITNTASWFFNPFHNPEYAKTLVGWIKALTMGTNGYPPTWEFFRNTLLSGGIFTAFFGIVGKFTAESPADKAAGAAEPRPAESESETEPEEAKA